MTTRKLGRRPGNPNTREKILDEAEYIIATRGPDGFTLQEVADRVGIRPPSIFSHFKGIPALTEEVYRRVLEGMLQAVTEPTSTDPLDKLQEIIEGFVEYLASHPAHVRLVLQQLASADRLSRALQHFESGTTILDRIKTYMDELLTDAAQTGKFRAESSPHIVSFIVGAALVRLSWDEFEDWKDASWPEQLSTIKGEIWRMTECYITA